MPARPEKIEAAIGDLEIGSINEKMGGIDFHYPAIFKLS
jgi:hypothetical protein